MKDKPITIELYELWNAVKSRFSIISPQPKSFELLKTVQPITSIDGVTLDFIDLTDSTSVASGGGTDLQVLQPPKGFIYQVIDLNFLASDPIGSSSGYHGINIRYQSFGGTDVLAYALANFGNSASIGKYGFGGSYDEAPGNLDTQMHMQHDYLFASYDQPLDFLYQNSTDVNQTGTRKLKIMVKKTIGGF